MQNIDLESFHSKIKTTIEVASSFIGTPVFKQLVSSCRLKPEGTFKTPIKLTWPCYLWVDEFGNSLNIKNFTVKKTVDQKNNISTDLFGCRSVISTMRDSKAVVLTTNCMLFYGHDEYFRCFSISGAARISPLEIGLNNLIVIMQNINSKYKSLDDNDVIIHALPNSKIESMIEKEYIKYE